MEFTTLIAPDISCEHCQRAIESALGELDGVSLVHVDIPGKSVQVNYDAQKLNQARLEEVLDNIGYTVAR